MRAVKVNSLALLPLRRECVMVKRRQQETLVGLHTVPMRLR